MGYLEIMDLVFMVLFGIMGLLAYHFIFFAIVGTFKKRSFAPAKQKLRYGIVISSRNEEAVIAKLCESIRRCDYPAEKLTVFVVAHNCTDRTAMVAREAGAIVYEYNNPKECTKGYALRHLFGRIDADYGIDSFDGFFVFDADNILERDYFNRMNDAFVACRKQSVITSFRNSKNFGSNLMSAFYGLYFVYGCRFESRGRSALGCSTRVQGTGYLLPTSTLREGWNYVTLTEDWELTADQVLQNTKIVYCDDAVFYDEQPTTFPVMWRQRLRWSRGHLLVCVTRLKELLCGLFLPEKRGGSRYKVSTYDITINILPVCVISTAYVFLQFLCYLLSPLFGYSLKEAIGTLLSRQLFVFAISYATMVLASFFLLFLERKRIPQMSTGLKIAAALFWPIFLLISVPSEIVALFAKNLGWKPIPHTDTTDFDALHPGSKKVERSAPSQLAARKSEGGKKEIA